jgi:hypothetical protein
MRFVTQAGATTTLGAVADLVVTDGPPADSKRERPAQWLGLCGRVLGGSVKISRTDAGAIVLTVSMPLPEVFSD